MTIARGGWKVKVVGQATAVGPTLIEGSFFPSLLIFQYTEKGYEKLQQPKVNNVDIA